MEFANGEVSIDRLLCGENRLVDDLFLAYTGGKLEVVIWAERIQ